MFDFMEIAINWQNLRTNNNNLLAILDKSGKVQKVEQLVGVLDAKGQV